MQVITLPCVDCNGEGFVSSTLPKTLNDPVRNVMRGCTPCGGCGTKITVPENANISNEVRAFYESGKGYEKGSGKVEVHYEPVGGPCVHCNGNKCQKCHMTGKLVRMIRQTPYQSGMGAFTISAGNIYFYILLFIISFFIFKNRYQIQGVLLHWLGN